MLTILKRLPYADYSSINFCYNHREIITLEFEVVRDDNSPIKKSPHEGILLNK